MVHTLLEAVLLVVLVVILFLQTWRASIIPLLAVPVSVVGTFAVMWLLGFSINVLTLFGLVLAIGIVVDDAIVVVENVERNIEDGLTPREAAHQAMSEVSGPDRRDRAGADRGVRARSRSSAASPASSTASSRVTIAISTVISAFNSLTLSPALAATLLQPARRAEGRAGRGHRPRARLVLPARSTASSAARSDGYGRRVGGSPTRTRADAGGLRRADRASPCWRSAACRAGFIPTQDKQYLFAVALLPEGAIARPHRAHGAQDGATSR